MSLYDLTEEELAKIKPTHVAYADEANPNFGRFRSVAAVSLKIDDCKNCKDKLNQILEESNVSEFKWHKLSSARYRFAAIKIIDLMLSLIEEKLIRIDAIIWDTEDSRHSINKRSDVRNLRRMYYFLFRNVLARRWGQECIWELHTDENTAGASSHLGYLGLPEEMNEDARNSNVLNVIEDKSNLEPLIQVADFFAGLVVYSRNSFTTYNDWTNLEEGQIKLSNSDLERCKVLDHLYKSCKERKLGVGLTSSKGLRTKNPKYPVNFWWYEPQGKYDKAPLWH
jgi:Protein of unknown function (DUF3800)